MKTVPSIKCFAQAPCLHVHGDHLKETVVHVETDEPALRVDDPDLADICWSSSPVLQISVGESDQLASFVAQHAKPIFLGGEKEKIFLLSLQLGQRGKKRRKNNNASW